MQMQARRKLITGHCPKKLLRMNLFFSELTFKKILSKEGQALCWLLTRREAVFVILEVYSKKSFFALFLLLVSALGCHAGQAVQVRLCSK